MNVHGRSLVTICALAMVSLACSRRTPEPQPVEEVPEMTPAAGSATPASPGRPRPRCLENFDAFDSDRDGKLTKDEFGAWPHLRGDAGTLFGERDLDHDGIITRAEFCPIWRP